MSADRLTILWEKYLADDLSPAERAEFKQLGTDRAHQQQLEALMKEVFEQGPSLVADDTVNDKEAIFQQVMQKARDSKAPVGSLQPTVRIPRWSWAAAMVLLFAGIAWFWLHHTKSKHVVVATVTPTDKAPGKDGAILTLANGTQVSLDSIKNGVVALQGGVTAKVVNGTLVYETNGADWVYNTVSTPRGRHFHVTLPDGSEVWLNSVSSIRYPTSFTGDKREVTITGEAYFEVAHNAQKPFTVNINNKAVVEVLGTHFDVNAYTDEAAIRTTLLEGKVVMKSEVGSQTSDVRLLTSVTLAPGEQGVAQEHSPRQGGQALTIDHSPNVEQVMAWKNGVFNFEDVSLKDAMRQLERWYDIDVAYEGAIPDIYFTGKMSRDINLSGVLKLLEDAKVRFRMEGSRRLVVTK